MAILVDKSTKVICQGIRAGRRLTLREQTYADYAPSEEVLETLRAEGLDSKP